MHGATAAHWSTTSAENKKQQSGTDQARTWIEGHFITSTQNTTKRERKGRDTGVS
jgi:hypothetical protein